MPDMSASAAAAAAAATAAALGAEVVAGGWDVGAAGSSCEEGAGVSLRRGPLGRGVPGTTGGSEHLAGVSHDDDVGAAGGSGEGEGGSGAATDVAAAEGGAAVMGVGPAAGGGDSNGTSCGRRAVDSSTDSEL